MVIVSDASPLRALHHLGLLHLCRELYGSVVVPEAVRLEMRQPTTTCPALEISSYAWFEVRSPQRTPTELGIPADLDAGEAEAIALALESNAELILMDERKATQTARGMRLATIGVFGVLLEAKRKRLIERVLPCVDRLVGDCVSSHRRNYGRSWQHSRMSESSMTLRSDFDSAFRAAVGGVCGETHGVMVPPGDGCTFSELLVAVDHR